MQVYRKELRTKKDIHRGDVETKEDIIDLSKGRAYGESIQHT